MCLYSSINFLELPQDSLRLVTCSCMGLLRYLEMTLVLVTLSCCQRNS